MVSTTWPIMHKLPVTGMHRQAIHYGIKWLPIPKLTFRRVKHFGIHQDQKRSKCQYCTWGVGNKPMFVGREVWLNVLKDLSHWQVFQKPWHIEEAVIVSDSWSFHTPFLNIRSNWHLTTAWETYWRTRICGRVWTEGRPVRPHTHRECRRSVGWNTCIASRQFPKKIFMTCWYLDMNVKNMSDWGTYKWHVY